LFKNKGGEGGPGKTDESYDHMSRMRTVFDKLSDPYSKFCNPPEYLLVEGIMVAFTGRFIFKHHVNPVLVSAVVTFLKKLG
jgi:hypothetical protein